MPDYSQVKVIHTIDDVDAKSWNDLTGGGYPFLRHEFLSALENHDCLGERTGWFARHMVFFNDRNELVAGVPMYIKTNSFGEFVFDWSWADAYARAKIPYYPKLVVASPFTPATGPRVLMACKYKCHEFYRKILAEIIANAEQSGVSSLHVLFNTDWETQHASELLIRTGCQFHWTNKGYQSFDDFLSRLTSRKRKQIKKERQQVLAQGIEIQLAYGHQVSASQWQKFHRLYCDTFAKHGNYPALTLGFFMEIGRTMADQVLLALAYRNDEITAVSFFLVGAETLYGRYWGCEESLPGLHFEACYYQGLDYCIDNGLARFEPGAQGEHKISRGFLPTKTWSLHWLRDRRFHAAIKDFIQSENSYLHDYRDQLHCHSPFKSAE